MKSSITKRESIFITSLSIFPSGHKIFYKQGQFIFFWGSCSLPDPGDFVSIRPSACCESKILKKAKKVIFKVNSTISFTYRSIFVPLEKINTLIKSDKDLPLYKNQISDNIDEIIAQNVADLIPNGATIRLGTGSISNSLASALNHKVD